MGLRYLDINYCGDSSGPMLSGKDSSEQQTIASPSQCIKSADTTGSQPASTWERSEELLNDSHLEVMDHSLEGITGNLGNVEPDTKNLHNIDLESLTDSELDVAARGGSLDTSKLLLRADVRYGAMGHIFHGQVTLVMHWTRDEPLPSPKARGTRHRKIQANRKGKKQFHSLALRFRPPDSFYKRLVCFRVKTCEETWIASSCSPTNSVKVVHN